ncbi:MAG: phosphoribosylamine--glycine ligase [Methanobacteriota archaeon]
MKVLVVGGGAREHAICDAVARSKDATLYSVMSNLNPGIERLATKHVIEKETQVDRVVEFADQEKIDLILIGPEAPLEAGLVDALQNKGIKVCAPTQAAARIETDKEWMRALLKNHKIPGQVHCESVIDVKKAKEFIDSLESNVVIKPIGLTGGKGVRVAGDHFNGADEALAYVKEVIEKKIGGAAKVLLEEKLEGEEFTLQAFSDGSRIRTLPAVQDHKRLLPDDFGPNTGGMGSYSCMNGLLPFLSQKEYDSGTRILQQVIHALNREGNPYIGPIYGQFILTKDGVKVIEFNARFGDPEAMNVLPLLQNDYVELCTAMLEGKLSENPLEVERKSTVCKYVVPEGYGVKSMVGEKIQVDESAITKVGAKLFYASVNKKDSDIVTLSSRSLAIVGIADDVDAAERLCEQGLSHVKGDHIFIRHDVGTKPLLEKRVRHMNRIRERK